MVLGEDQVEQLESSADPEFPSGSVLRVTSNLGDDMIRKARLIETIKDPKLPDAEKRFLCGFLAKHHHTFSLDPKDRGRLVKCALVVPLCG